MLERYGIVARELLELESVSLPWGALYDALNMMELTGEIRRGYFVEGFSGAQFGLPRACDELKSLQERQSRPAPEFVLLNTCDPANLYGAAIRGTIHDGHDNDGREIEEPAEQDTGSQAAPGPRGPTILRLPTNYLVLRDGVPALLLETSARRLTPLLPLQGPEL